MSVYVLKAHVNPIPDRDDRDPLDRIIVSVHPSHEAAEAAAQKRFEETYGNPGHMLRLAPRLGGR